LKLGVSSERGEERKSYEVRRRKRKNEIENLDPIPRGIGLERRESVGAKARSLPPSLTLVPYANISRFPHQLELISVIYS